MIDYLDLEQEPEEWLNSEQGPEEWLDLEQGSQEWLEFRKKHIGCSELSSILGFNPYKSAYMLWLEKTGLIEPEKRNEAMLRGIAMEPDARDKFIETTGIDMVPKVLIYKKWDTLMASLDGISMNHKSILEVKCPNSRKLYDQALDKLIPDYYFAQMQFQLLISEAEVCYYFVYLNTNEYQLIEVYPDYKYIEDNFYKIKEFWNMITTNTPPTRVKGDPLFLEELYAKNIATDCKLINSKIKEMEIELKNKKDLLSEYLKNEDYVIFSDSGVEARKIVKTGTVDWNKISDDYSITEDIKENYRKENSEYIRFKL